MPPRAFEAAIRVSQVLWRRYGTTRVRRLKSSSGCAFWTSANCCAAVKRINWVLPVSRSLQNSQPRLSRYGVSKAERRSRRVCKLRAGRRDPRDKAIQSVARDVSTRDFTAVRDGGTDLEAMADTRPHYLDDGGELKWS